MAVFLGLILISLVAMCIDKSAMHAIFYYKKFKVNKIYNIDLDEISIQKIDEVIPG